MTVAEPRQQHVVSRQVFQAEVGVGAAGRDVGGRPAVHLPLMSDQVADDPVGTGGHLGIETRPLGCVGKRDAVFPDGLDVRLDVHEPNDVTTLGSPPLH